MAATGIRLTKLENLAPADAAEDASDAVVFEGDEATAFIGSLNAGTASAAYLREADSLLASIFRAEPANDLFN
jgi:hypothetical protein